MWRVRRSLFVKSLVVFLQVVDARIEVWGGSLFDRLSGSAVEERTGGCIVKCCGFLVCFDNPTPCFSSYSTSRRAGIMWRLVDLFVAVCKFATTGGETPDETTVWEYSFTVSFTMLHSTSGGGISLYIKAEKRMKSTKNSNKEGGSLLM